MDIRWSKHAFEAATEAATPDGAAAMKRERQALWDADHIRTESTRFPVDLDAKLREYCNEAGKASPMGRRQHQNGKHQIPD